MTQDREARICKRSSRKSLRDLLQNFSGEVEQEVFNREDHRDIHSISLSLQIDRENLSIGEHIHTMLQSPEKDNWILGDVNHAQYPAEESICKHPKPDRADWNPIPNKPYRSSITRMAIELRSFSEAHDCHDYVTLDEMQVSLLFETIANRITSERNDEIVEQLIEIMVTLDI